MSSSAAAAAAARMDPRREFLRQVNTNVGKCVESMAQLIKTAKMSSVRENAYLEANRVSVLTATILQSSEQLMTQLEQLKRLHVLQDFDALNIELDQAVCILEARQDALGEEVLQWTGVVKEAADRQLAKIVDGCREEGGEVV
ncbi:Hypothetical protein NocV09_01300900 [Nannochloropsis oceanica]